MNNQENEKIGCVVFTIGFMILLVIVGLILRFILFVAGL